MSLDITECILSISPQYNHVFDRRCVLFFCVICLALGRLTETTLELFVCAPMLPFLSDTSWFTDDFPCWFSSMCKCCESLFLFSYTGFTFYMSVETSLLTTNDLCFVPCFFWYPVMLFGNYFCSHVLFSSPPFCNASLHICTSRTPMFLHYYGSISPHFTYDSSSTEILLSFSLQTSCMLCLICCVVRRCRVLCIAHLQGLNTWQLQSVDLVDGLFSARNTVLRLSIIQALDPHPFFFFPLDTFSLFSN